MRVKIIYRNYKPLHDLYASLKIEPPQDVSFIIPAPRKSLRRFYPLYLRFGDNFLAQFIISKAQEFFFDLKNDEDIDILHFTQMTPKNPPSKPYVIDFEHVVSLANFLELDKATLHNIFYYLSHPQCKKIIPLSYAAQRSLEYLFGDLADKIKDKIEVVYPALPNYYALYKDQVDYSYVSPHSEILKLLFVGNDVYKKGLHELLAAFKKLESKYEDIELYVISNAPRQLRERYPSKRIKYFDPQFSNHDIAKKFYLACDLFVLPTHGDTFGMAFLHALSCGTPVLTTKQFATPEIIRPGHNGLFVQSNRLYLKEVPLPSRKTTKTYYKHIIEENLLIDELVHQIEYLYFNRDVLATMGQQAIKDFEPGGKFSIDVRNEKLRKIYMSCYSSLRSSA